MTGSEASPAELPRRVLVVDDEPSVRRVLRTLLEQDGYVVSEAGEGGAALARLDEEPADLVLVDLFMPGVDGLEFLQTVRSSWPALPVVAVSGQGSCGPFADVLEVARAFGARATLRKPFSLGAFRAALDTALRAP